MLLEKHGLNDTLKDFINYMVRILSFLLLLISSNAYAWYCTYVPDNNGYITNLQCYDIDDATALTGYWCPYHPNDPICEPYRQPVCTDATETRTLSCPVNYSGALNEVRYYTCSTSSWSVWQEASNNCVADPPSCVSSTETRTLSCLNGYEGLITELRISQCFDPYGLPTWTAWSETSNTCKMTLDNQDNVSSPVSVISPVNPNGILNTSVTPTITESVIAQVEPVQTFNNALNSTTSEVKPELKKEDAKSENKKDIEIVPGLGIVLSLALLQSPNNLTQPLMVDSYNLTQENNYGLQQGIYMGLITQTSIFDRFNAYSSRRNADLLWNYDFQQNAFSR
jgi:hypothetical protein